MKPSEIIQADAQRQQYDGQKVARDISAMVNSKQAILLQENDSVLILIKLPQGAVELHLFTADSPLTLSHSLSGFIKKIRASDIKKVYGSAEVPQLLKLLQRLDVEVQQSDDPKYKWMALV